MVDLHDSWARELAAQAVAVYPGLAAHEASFIDALASRPRVSEVFAGAMLLAHAAAHGDPKAIAIFETSFFTAIARHVRHFDASPAFADEVTQILRVRLLVAEVERAPRIAEYAGRGSLEGFLKVASLRVAVDLRRRARGGVDSDIDAVPETGADPEVDYLRSRYGKDFESAFVDAIASLSPEDRTLLKLFYVDRSTLDDLARLYRVHASTMSRRIASIRETLASETRDVLASRIAARPEEMSTLIRALESQLAVSVRRLLGDFAPLSKIDSGPRKK